MGGPTLYLGGRRTPVFFESLDEVAAWPMEVTVPPTAIKISFFIGFLPQ